MEVQNGHGQTHIMIQKNTTYVAIISVYRSPLMIHHCEQQARKQLRGNNCVHESDNPLKQSLHGIKDARVLTHQMLRGVCEIS